MSDETEQNPEGKPAPEEDQNQDEQPPEDEQTPEDALNETVIEQTDLEATPEAESEEPKPPVQNKIQIYPGKSARLCKTNKYLPTLPTIPNTPGKYTPFPYTFRVLTGTKPARICKVTARSPPLHLLLDHTIAILWQLFSDDQNVCLGIAQLQWALSFLKSIVDRHGERAKDICFAVSTIEDLLIEKYAEMKQAEHECHTKYFDGVYGCADMIKKVKIPFSLNYVEMIGKYPNGDVVMRRKQSTLTQEEIEEGLINLRNEDKPDKNKAIGFLNMAQTEQVEKIRDDMRKLKSIEDMLKDIDVANFREFFNEENIKSLYQQLQ